MFECCVDNDCISICMYERIIDCVGSSPAPVSEGASTIHLPVKDCHITEGTNCTMYGWGETKSTTAFSHQYATFHRNRHSTKARYVWPLTLTGFCNFHLLRYRIRWGTEHCNHADGQQRHVLANQRGCWREQNMRRRQERRRCMWCKEHKSTSAD